MVQSGPQLPFDGIVVLELGQRLGVAACGALLAGAGATVVVAEPAGADAGKFKNRALSCAGKCSIVIRPGDADDAALLTHAIAAADVIITSSDLPDDLLEAAAAAGPDTIVCDITALAHETARSELLCDKLVQALTGIAAVTGTATGAPALSDATILDLGAGIYGAAAIAAALRVRRIHGGGQRVGASMYGAGINALTTFLPFHFNGKVPPRAGNRHPMCAPWNAYEASDGWILLCSANDDQWKRLCAVMGRPELAGDGPMANLVDRVKNVDQVDAVVQGWVGTQTVDDAVTALGKSDIAAGPIVAVQDLPQNPNVRHRAIVRRLHDPESGSEVEIVASPLASGRAPQAIPARNADRALVLGLTPKAQRGNSAEHDVKPLAGVRVLEIGQYTTAPLAAKQMAAMGADVIKVEPTTGEASRAWPPHLNGESYFFTLNNANKRSLAVDLRTERDRALFADLLRGTDVLVENLKPGSLARLGFSVQELHALNPRLVYCAISGYGQDSVYPGRPAFDTVIQAMCGLMDLTRTDDVPTKLGISIADTTGGMVGLFCILAMLELRERTGKGAFIDLAMQDVGLWVTQTGWRPDLRTRHTIVACADGDVAAIGERPGIEKRLAAANCDAAAHTRDEVAATLMGVGIPAAPVRTIDEVGCSEQKPGGFIRLVDAGPSRWPLLELPFRLSRMPDYDLKPIGALGTANAEFTRPA
jgi:crotonobetainyl-CoA:carnitine CoA-transferase CaiB-like acyl-CoA transferase